MNRKVWLAIVLLGIVASGYGWRSHATMLADPIPRAAVVGKITAADNEYHTLTELTGHTQSFFFKGYIAMDPANVGAANVLKATISGASDVTCAAGAVKDWAYVSSDSVQIKLAIDDKLNIVGEDCGYENKPF